MIPARIPSGLGLQVRFASSLSVKKSQEVMADRQKSLFDKIPSLYTMKVPNQAQFTHGADLKAGNKRVYNDPRVGWRLLKRPKVDEKDRPDAVLSFRRMHLHPYVLTALDDMKVTVPSVIQQTAIPLAMEGKTVALCAPTGSGKTVAFLAPIFHRMLLDRQNGIELRPHRPRAVVIAPTFELVHQLWGVAAKIGSTTGFAVKEYYGGQSVAAMKQELNGVYDVLVATPTGYRRMRDKGWLVDSDIKYMAYDEADLSVGGSYHEWARPADTETFFSIFKPLMKKQFERDSYLGRHKVQFLLSSSSLTTAYTTRVSEWFPHVHRVYEENSHVVPRCLSHKFYHLSQKDKLDHLRAVLATLGIFPDKDRMKREADSRSNLWFPDAVTFEPGHYHPLDENTHVMAMRPGIPELAPSPHRHLEGKTKRPAYLKDYSPETVSRSHLLPPPLALSGTLLTEKVSPSPGQTSSEAEENFLVSVEKDLATTTPESSSALMVVNNTLPPLITPEMPASPKIIWGPLSTTAAPFTGLPGLMPQRYPALGARVMLFVDTVKELRKVARYLQDRGYRVASFYGLTGVGNHSLRVNQFESWATGEASILLTTDIAARGLDHYVEAVINYSIPTFPADYINRAGRAGRMGRKGFVHTFVIKNDRVQRQYAKRLEIKLARNQALNYLMDNSEAMKLPVKVWHKRHQKKMDRRWSVAQWRGFVTRKEELRMKAQTLNKLLRPIPNPRDKLGASTKADRKEKEKVLARKQWHLSWQYHMSTGGTGSLDAMHGRPGKLIRKGPAQVRNLGPSTDDIRTSYLWKPLNKDKQQHNWQRYGRYATPLPLNLPNLGKGADAYHSKVSYPSMFAGRV
ncbi:DEAD-box ATP-dependent RNA helicase 39 [Diplonema papillatum]|nr:DEAD-box ATP-dependent RNA helicase 39 [Diplonema papillatum]